MLFRNAFITGVIYVGSLPFLLGHGDPDGVYLPLPRLRQTAGPNAVRQGESFVRVRLLEELGKHTSIASVRLPAGSTEGFIVEVKPSALSSQLLAAAFAARSHVAAMRSKRPQANIVIYIPATFSPPILSPDDAVKFGRIVSQLRARPPGEFIEVNGL